MTDPTEQSRPPRRHLIRRLLAWACRVALFVVILAFAAGRAFSDHAFWSQWLFWTPPEVWLLLIWILAVATALLEPPGPRRPWASLGPVLAALLVLGYVGIDHWRLQNALLRTPGQTVLRLYHWNATEATDASLQDLLHHADPFGLTHDAPAIVVLANPPLRLDWPEIVRALADREIGGRATRHVRRCGRFVVISGPPISQAGWVSLALEARTADPGVIDSGAAMFAGVQFDGQALTVWAIDWPSDPERSRMAFVPETLDRIEKSTRVVFEPTAAGPLRERRERGFPPPDIAVGDFNTARGSAAVARLLPGMASAHAQAGIGPDYAWPRFVRLKGRDRPTVPFLGLDQAFVQRVRWRATAYRVLDMGRGTHRAQELFISWARRDRADAARADRAAAN